jgi:hypothetical protein
MNLRSAHLLLAAGIAILFTACKEGNIYYTLENEVKVDDLSLPNDITLFDVTKIDDATPPAFSAYYAAAGKIYTVPVADLDVPDAGWDKYADVDAPASDALCTALVTSPYGSQNTLFGGFINGSGNLGLYKSSPRPTKDTVTWTVDSDPIIAGAQIALLKTENDGADDWLVAVTARHLPGKNFTFGIAGFNGTNWYEFDTTIRGSPENEKPFNDVIWSQKFGRWLATGGTKLYMQVLSPPAVDSFSDAYMTGITSGEVLTGMYEDVTNVYIASKSGAVYYSPTYGTDWKRIEALPISGTNPPLTHFAGPVGSGILLVGSDGYGYYRLDTTILTSTDPYPLTRYPTTTSDLYTASVMKFFYDDDPGINRVFACTAMGGLWRGAVAADGTIDWNLE